MTGEITLTGRVLPIGGVKEKLLGAYRAGIRTIVIPRDNLADLEDLPAEVVKALRVHAVESIDEALAITLEGASFSGGALRFQPGLAPTPGRIPETETRLHQAR